MMRVPVVTCGLLPRAALVVSGDSGVVVWLVVSDAGRDGRGNWSVVG